MNEVCPSELETGMNELLLFTLAYIDLLQVHVYSVWIYFCITCELWNWYRCSI